MKFFLVFWMFLFPAGAAEPASILLQPGESRKIPSRSFEKTWLSRGQIISLTDGGHFLKIQARRPGAMFLSVGGKVYKIQVLPAGLKSHFQALKQWTDQRAGLQTQVFFDPKPSLHITGDLLRIKDFKDLFDLTQKQNISYLFSAKVPSPRRGQLTLYLKSQLLHQSPKGFAGPLVLAWGEQPLAAVLPAEHPYFKIYEEHFKKYGLAVKKDQSLIALKPLTQIKLLLVETGGHASLQNAFSWEKEEAANPLTEDHFAAQLLKQSFQKWLSLFKALEHKGSAHILAQAVLLNENGQTSRFHSGGEVPIPTFHPKTGAQSIRWKPYGIRLSFQTKTGRKQNIHIQTQVKISDVNHAKSSAGAPSIQSHSLNSSVTLQSGQTLTLSTLIRKQGGRGGKAPHLITRLPLAGSVLSSEGRIKVHTRLNIFITAKQVPR